ncbi:MAG: carboxypeptidase-like regulatory domain-containing protein [Ferruginibacter sp.]|nr:carboxypeptidase-like regulatory domain-containing protein [Ferruginibacter sp.]
MKLKLILLLFVSAFHFTYTNAQSYFTITGKVVNDSNSLPMAAASVFAQNTTLGTVTDNEGNFKLTLPNGGYDLIISFTGFVTESVRISANDITEKIQIKLKEKNKNLESVAIISTNEVKDGFAKYGTFFKDEFIGNSTNSEFCSIQNIDVLHFFFSKKKNKLKVTATAPLIIKNNALGYIIKYELDSFIHEFKTETTAYTGYPLFENMEGDSAQMQQWYNTRQEAYKGSMLHFMRSIYNKNLIEQAFEIQFVVNVMGKSEGIKLKDIYPALNYSKDDSAQLVEILPNQNNLAILYYAAKPSAKYLKENPDEFKEFKLSQLNFKPGESIVIEQNGFFYNQNDITTTGYWAWDKMAELLPYDYIER